MFEPRILSFQGPVNAWVPLDITVLHLAKKLACRCRIARTCKWLAVGLGAVGAALVAWKLSGGVATLVERRKLR